MTAGSQAAAGPSWAAPSWGCWSCWAWQALAPAQQLRTDLEIGEQGVEMESVFSGPLLDNRVARADAPAGPAGAVRPGDADQSGHGALS